MIKTLSALVAGSMTLLALNACKKAPEEPSKSASVILETNLPVETLATGTFSGRNDHIVTGDVRIVETGGKRFVELAADFSLDNAPDPKVGLGAGNYDPSTNLGHLQNNTGSSRYDIPEGLDTDQYSEVYIWCDRFSVALGVATLED